MYHIIAVNMFMAFIVFLILYTFCFSVTLTEKTSLCPHRTLSVSRQPPALAELTSLYVGRTHSLWREAAVMLWLEESVKEVLCRVDAKDPLVEDCINK